MKNHGMRKFWMGSTATLAVVLIVLVSVVAVYVNSPVAPEHTKTNNNKKPPTYEPMVTGAYAPVGASEHFCGGDAGVCAL